MGCASGCIAECTCHLCEARISTREARTRTDEIVTVTEDIVDRTDAIDGRTDGTGAATRVVVGLTDRIVSGTGEAGWSTCDSVQGTAAPSAPTHVFVKELHDRRGAPHDT